MRSIFRQRLSLKVRVGLGIAATAALAPVAAHAVVGGFSDVPDGHTHAAGIQWVKDSGVTAGCTPTTYCPDSSVTRAQMATFMQRLAGHAPGVAPSVDAATLGGLTAAEVAALGGGGGAPATPSNPFGYATGGTVVIDNSNAWTDLAGATTNITIPAGYSGTAVLNFTAESACYGADGYCRVRILVDGAEAEPNVNTDFAFNSSDGNTEGIQSYESLALQRITAGLGAGTHTIQVQLSNYNGTSHRIDDWALTAEAHLS